MKQRKGWRMSCDVGKARETLKNELWRRWSDGKFVEWALLSHFTYVTAHSPTLPSLYLRHRSFSSPFRCFTYVIGTSSTSQLILQPFRRFTYVTDHSTILPLLHLRHRQLHLRHSLFSNLSAALPTSQLILQPFRCFTYVTGTSRTSPGEPPMHRGMKKPSVVD